MFLWNHWVRSLSKKLVITDWKKNGEEFLAALLLDQEQALQIQLEPREQENLLGNIYVGRVEKVVEGMQAAFVEIAPGKSCYLPLTEAEYAIFTSRRIHSAPLRAGDELLVQVSKEAIKSKVPRVTACPELAGRYLIFTAGKKRLNFSARLPGCDKKALQSLLEPVWKEGTYSLIVRTNAAGAPPEEVLRELNDLKQQWKSIKERGLHRTCFSLLRSSEPFYLSVLRDTSFEELEKIQTDDPAVFDEMKRYLEEYAPQHVEKLTIYQDSLLPLSKLCRMEAVMAEALSEKVWLKSGGFLVIQQTEALTAIDVNSGKYTGKKDSQQVYKKINLEAAKEIARQLRLRSLSGILIVDFINLEKEEDRQELLETFDHFVRQDPIKTRVIDMTALQLVEVTRKKVRRSLAEQLNRSFRKDSP